MSSISSWKSLAALVLTTFCLVIAGCSDDSPAGEDNGNWDVGTPDSTSPDTGTCDPQTNPSSKPEGWCLDPCSCEQHDGDWVWICQARVCPMDVSEEDADAQTDATADTGTCTPGETKDVDCNTCHCTDEGVWGCTLAACLDDPCEGKTCGDECSTCDANAGGDCPSVIEYCNADGACVTETPACDA